MTAHFLCIIFWFFIVFIIDLFSYSCINDDACFVLYNFSLLLLLQHLNILYVIIRIESTKICDLLFAQMLSWIIIYWSIRHRHAYPNVVCVFFVFIVFAPLKKHFVRLVARIFCNCFFFLSFVISILHKPNFCNGNSSKRNGGKEQESK